MKKLLFLSLCLLFFAAKNPDPVTWVAIGDSITYLNDHPDETGNRISKGYLTLIREKFPELQVVNKGYNGWTAVRIAQEFDKLEIPRADIYSIFLGTNDWWGGKPLGSLSDFQNGTGHETVNGAFRVILDKIYLLNPEAKIILITPMKRVDFVYINNPKNNAFGSYQEKNGQDLEDFADAIKGIGTAKNLPVVNLYHQRKMDFPDLVNYKWLKNPETGKYQKYRYPDFANLPFDPEQDEYPYPEKTIAITYDGLHPSDKGYRIIADELQPIFENLLK
ncbi:SGNH/GDSL hydrolase family protein [Algoriphagus sp. H41]|uniref:SGNH/GDSL hydrolase family protein n=1 Tax=Algoriphagus oliviformis TaxID=2811231 RepID=A0ABS3BWZ8_9BACT|nr:SGNH/GDSL hydrolase family protein [Algoriphagus oliviformis]MBN7809390.1 SGNH/GDSL hydrolase family protein [Algoriphagus oliviformis]